MKLIPLSDFVEKYTPPVISDNKSSDVAKLFNNLKLISNYTKFLRQPLTLGMFIPVDNHGMVLEEPVWQCEYEKRKVSSAKLNNIAEQYQKAKEKILFKGNYTTGMFDNRISEMAVEDLVKFDFELTPSALEAIGIKG